MEAHKKLFWCVALLLAANALAIALCVSPHIHNLKGLIVLTIALIDGWLVQGIRSSVSEIVYRYRTGSTRQIIHPTTRCSQCGGRMKPSDQSERTCRNCGHTWRL